jgi:hypothetical protein
MGLYNFRSSIIEQLGKTTEDEKFETNTEFKFALATKKMES